MGNIKSDQDLRQSPPWVKYMRSIGWQTEVISTGTVFIRRLPLIGSLIKAPRINFPISTKELDQLARKHRALFIKIEPNVTIGRGVLQHAPTPDFSLDRWSFAPTKTIVIDLTPSEEEILKRMEKDTRYSIRLAERKGVKVTESDDLEIFLRLYQKTARRKGFWIGPTKELIARWKHFSEAGAGKIYLAFTTSPKEPLAAAIVFFHDQTAYYYHAASSEENRQLMAPYLLLWEIIRYAKKQSCRTLDLEGIHDPRIPSTRNWQGFTHFKRGFGGEEVEYLGSFTRYYNPLLKILFRVGNLVER